MSMAKIREQYGVPARRGVRVEYTGGSKPEMGTVVRASGAHLIVKLDGHIDPYPFHPTWKLSYLPAEKGQTP